MYLFWNTVSNVFSAHQYKFVYWRCIFCPFSFLHVLKTCKKCSSLFWLRSTALRTPPQVLCGPPWCLTWKVSLEGNVTKRPASSLWQSASVFLFVLFLFFHFKKRSSDWLCFSRLKSPFVKPSQRTKWEGKWEGWRLKCYHLQGTEKIGDSCWGLKSNSLHLRHDGRSPASGQCLL